MSFVIPAIDLIDGKAVRLKEGNYLSSSVFREDPVGFAKELEALGFNRLHLVDLDGAKEGSPRNFTTLRAIAAETSLSVDFSGGLRSIASIRDAFNYGAQFVALGSAAIENRPLFDEVLEEFGRERVILGADVRDGLIATRGWLNQSAVPLVSLLEGLDGRIEFVSVTDISRDGMLQGPAVGLYRDLREQFPGLKLIASGGVRSIEDVVELRELGASGVIVGRALFELDLEELSRC
jgi:phosphoribosylformimino-5-aminoimidazole carboxamide ribotide isomerase